MIYNGISCYVNWTNKKSCVYSVSSFTKTKNVKLKITTYSTSLDEYKKQNLAIKKTKLHNMQKLRCMYSNRMNDNDNLIIVAV